MSPKTIPKVEVFQGFNWGEYQPNPTITQNIANLNDVETLKLYGELLAEGDIQQLAKAMQLVDTPDKMQKHSQLKQAIHNLEGMYYKT